ncbi:transposase [Azotobacter chroococcum]|nr:transposase [Azotobacter chroococcum]TKD43611.1 transposase [Azotobacter chroococcum]
MAFSWPSACVILTPKKTPHSARHLPYPKSTFRGAAQRPQRHQPNSITTLRWLIAQRLASRLDRCPCCGRKNSEQMNV